VFFNEKFMNFAMNEMELLNLMGLTTLCFKKTSTQLLAIS